MDLGDLISPDGITPSLKAKSKKQALQILAEHAADFLDINQREIFDTLLQRERLGSTGIGHGIAIPHGKLNSINSIFSLFARLENPIT